MGYSIDVHGNNLIPKSNAICRAFYLDIHVEDVDSLDSALKAYEKHILSS
jgi:hypothetical protein